MKLIEFAEQTCVIAKDQPPYLPFPCHKVVEPEGRVIALWKLTIEERIKLLFTGKIWHTVLTFNQSLQPQLLEVNNPFQT